MQLKVMIMTKFCFYFFNKEKETWFSKQDSQVIMRFGLGYHMHFHRKNKLVSDKNSFWKTCYILKFFLDISSYKTCSGKYYILYGKLVPENSVKKILL